MLDPKKLFAEFHECLKQGDCEKAMESLKNSYVYKPGARDAFGNNLLHIVAKYKNVDGIDDLAKHLIKIGCNINVKNKKNQPPLTVAISFENLDVINVLLEHDCLLCNSYYYNFDGPLHLAALKNNYDMIEMFIYEGCSVLDCNLKRETPLHYSMMLKKNNETIVELLLDSGADVNARCDKGFAPIHYARKKSMLELLLSRGADPNVKTNGNLLPLHCALMKQARYNVIESLVNLGNDVKYVDDKGRTPLHYACQYLNFKIIKFLLQKGASVNILDNDGLDPLCYGLQNMIYLERPSRNFYKKYFLRTHLRLMRSNNCLNLGLLHVDESSTDEQMNMEFDQERKSLYCIAAAGLDKSVEIDARELELQILLLMKIMIKQGIILNREKADINILDIVFSKFPFENIVRFLLDLGMKIHVNRRKLNISFTSLECINEQLYLRHLLEIQKIITMTKPNQNF